MALNTLKEWASHNGGDEAELMSKLKDLLVARNVRKKSRRARITNYFTLATD